MTIELLRGIAQLVALFVLGASVVAAAVQLRHMRGANELDATLALERDFRSAALQAALADIPAGLQRRLNQPRYRDELVRPGFLDPAVHPEMTVLNWFESVAGMVLAGFLNERRFLSVFGRLVEYYWGELGPVIELMRRARGPHVYERFERLAARAREQRAHGAHALPRFERIVIADPWLTEDIAPEARV